MHGPDATCDDPIPITIMKRWTAFCYTFIRRSEEFVWVVTPTAGGITLCGRTHLEYSQGPFDFTLVHVELDTHAL